MKGAQTWTPQKENKAEWKLSFILRQIYFSANNDMQQHENILTYDLAQCNGFKKINNSLKMAK
jgi:hypothetical protein